MQLRLLPVFLLLAAALLPALAAAESNPRTWVEGTLDVAQPDLRNLTFSGSFDVHRFTFSVGGTVTADQLRDDYAAFPSQAQKDAYVKQLEDDARAAFEGDLAAAFPTASRVVSEPVVDATTLDASLNGGGTTNPVKMTVAATITRSSADVGLGKLSDAAVAAAFHAGARVDATFTLSAAAGYDTTYRLAPPQKPAGLAFVATSVGALAPDGSRLDVRVDNGDGNAAKTQPVRASVADRSAHAPSAERIDTAIDVTVGALQQGVTKLPLASQVTASIHAVDVAKRFPTALPANVKLAVLSADGLRALHQTGGITDAQLADASDALDKEIASSLPDATVTGGFVPADLAAAPASPYASDPPVRYAASATSTYDIPGRHAGDADLALRIGATVRFDVKLAASADRANDYTIHAPPGAVFTQAANGQLSADAKSAAFHLAAGGGNQTATLAMRGADAPSYDSQKADVGVLVDLNRLDVSLGKAIKGDFGTMHADITVTGQLGVVKIPDDVKSSLGPNVDLAYLNSDAIRLLKQRGVLTDANVSTLENDLKKQVTEGLAGALGGDVPVTGGLDADTLDASGVGAVLSADKPITFTAHASLDKALSGSSSSEGAIALYTLHQTFDFPKVNGLDTTYTLIVPKGLAITGASVPASQGTATTGTAPDGRSQVVVKPSGDAASTRLAIAVTPTFIVAKFWPVLLLAVIVLVLIVGTPIAIVASRRRKSKGKSP
ncbi:MAG: hypothetical protein QOE90_1055 [Thermoplasmata archaeon]|jgi:hypothetical protein|nr:hypothetical protein [Thermoplasmata archaeon]